MARRGRKRRLGLEDEYWKLMADGVGTVMACRQLGIGRKTGYRWRAESGGLAPQRDSEQMHSSRYLSLLDRQRIASLRARGVDADEDANEDVGPRRGLMIPASMGLRFQIPADLDIVTVTARWGTYRSRRVERAETEEDTGRPSWQRSEYVRTPWEVTERLLVSDLVDNPHQSMKLSGTITLEVDTYVAGDRILVELALCNNRETPSRIPTEA